MLAEYLGNDTRCLVETVGTGYLGSKREETLLALDESSKVIVICRYGFSSLPIAPSWNAHTDGSIDAANSSFGATTLAHGEIFSEDYLAKADKKYISPDKTIDASTCLFPEKTWFVKNFQHSEGCDDIDTMIYTLLDYEKEATVNTFKEYPRFMKYNEPTDEIFPDDGTNKIILPDIDDIKDEVILKFKIMIYKIQSLFAK